MQKPPLFSMESHDFKKKKGQLKKGCILFNFKCYTFESMEYNVKIFPKRTMLFARDINGHHSLFLSNGKKFTCISFCAIGMYFSPSRITLTS